MDEYILFVLSPLIPLASLRLHRFLPTSRAEGPGLRAVLWVQGCSRHCHGCAVPNTWNENDGFDVDVEPFAEGIKEIPVIEGITFLGGEPFEQAEPLAVLGRTLQDAGLSVVTFTGFEIEELRAADRQDWNALLAVSDILIDGPFVETLLSTARPWVGSANQRYHFLTDRYKSWEERLHEIPNRLEIRLTPDGNVFVNGLTTKDVLDRLAKLS